VKKINFIYHHYTNSINIENVSETTYRYVIREKDFSNKMIDIFDIYLLDDIYLIHFKKYLHKEFNKNLNRLWEDIEGKTIFISLSSFIYMGKLNNILLRL